MKSVAKMICLQCCFSSLLIRRVPLHHFGCVCSLFWPNTNWFLERQVAGAQIVLSSFIVSEACRLIWSQRDKNGKSGCNVAVIMWMTCCYNPTQIDRVEATPQWRETEGHKWEVLSVGWHTQHLLTLEKCSSSTASATHPLTIREVVLVGLLISDIILNKRAAWWIYRAFPP